jgi:hypothetical protein
VAVKDVNWLFDKEAICKAVNEEMLAATWAAVRVVNWLFAKEAICEGIIEPI